MTLAITIEDVKSAARQIEGVAVRTPLIENIALNKLAGGRVFVKPECLQHTGSFKFRGAYNRLSRLSDAEKARGVLAFSSGNHAQGIARAAEILGIAATIVMPEDAPTLKLEATKGYGAKVVLYDRYNEDREEVAYRVAGDSGVTVVPPYNDPFIMAGQGTSALEVAEDLSAMDVTPDQALICCGGGGLASGSFTVYKHFFPEMQGYAVEPEAFDDVARSLESGKIETVDFGARSICDALLTPSPGTLTFPVMQDAGAKGLTISDDEARRAVAFACNVLKVTAEPGGAAALAALLAGKVPTKDRVTVLIISGGNIDPKMMQQCLQDFS